MIYTLNSLPLQIMLVTVKLRMIIQNSCLYKCKKNVDLKQKFALIIKYYNRYFTLNVSYIFAYVYYAYYARFYISKCINIRSLLLIIFLLLLKYFIHFKLLKILNFIIYWVI